MSGDTSLLEGKPGFAMDFNFFVEDNTVVIDEADAREQQGCVLVPEIDAYILRAQNLTSENTPKTENSTYHSLFVAVLVVEMDA